MSSSGQKIAAVGRGGDGKVWVSTDYGSTWNSYGTVSTGPGRRGVKYSGDGTKLITGISGGNMEISNRRLTSLKGSPKYIGGTISCFENNSTKNINKIH